MFQLITKNKTIFEDYLHFCYKCTCYNIVKMHIIRLAPCKCKSLL